MTLAVWTILISIPPSNAFAMPSASVATFDNASIRQAQISHIVADLSGPQARAHMMMMGVSPIELREQLAQLDDEQLASVAQKSNQVKVAGDAGLGIIITILVIAILAIIFVRLSNHQRIN